MPEHAPFLIDCELAVGGRRVHWRIRPGAVAGVPGPRIVRATAAIAMVLTTAFTALRVIIVLPAVLAPIFLAIFTPILSSVFAPIFTPVRHSVLTAVLTSIFAPVLTAVFPAVGVPVSRSIFTAILASILMARLRCAAITTWLVGRSGRGNAEQQQCHRHSEVRSGARQC